MVRSRQANLVSPREPTSLASDLSRPILWRRLFVALAKAANDDDDNLSGPLFSEKSFTFFVTRYLLFVYF